MNERVASGRCPRRPPVSYHRLPPYLRPIPGRPAHLEMFFSKRGASPKDPITGCPLLTAYRTPGETGSSLNHVPLPNPVSLDLSLSRPVQLGLDVSISASPPRLQQDAQYYAFSLPQVRGLREWLDEDVEEHPAGHRDEDDHFPSAAHTNRKRRRHSARRSKAHVNKQVLLLLLPFSKLSLYPPKERSAGRDTVRSAAQDKVGGTVSLGERGLPPNKGHTHKDITGDQPLDLSRKRKRSDLVITVGDKHRSVEATPLSLPDVEIVNQVETGEAVSTAANPGNVSRRRRRVWRRKQGSSHTKQMADVASSTTNRPRIQRLAETPLDLSMPGQRSR